MLTIGSLKLKSNLILAPLSGISDLPFRLLNRAFGCELAFVEMLNARSLSSKSKKSKQMLAGDPGDKPLGVQLLGTEPVYLLKAMAVIEKYPVDVLDFNAACPERKVTRRGEGASLLNHPKKLHDLLKLLVEHSRLPVTVKIRAGWNKDLINAREVALHAQDAGISALFIHGRTREQGYSGKVDYDVIRDVKRALRIPVIASGDVLSAELAKKMFDETGCDGILVARGGLGYPWLFKEIAAFLKNGTILPKPDRDDVVKVIIDHLEASIAFHGEKVGIVIFRKFFHWYTRGFRYARPIREKSCSAKTKEQLLSVIEEFRKIIPHRVESI
jgi:tRNA-dihydrouridine synthase B